MVDDQPVIIAALRQMLANEADLELYSVSDPTEAVAQAQAVEPAVILQDLVMDGLDGRVARLTGTSSEFGVQYDSLADLVSFGMAPALVMYHWSLSDLQFDGPIATRRSTSSCAASLAMEMERSSGSLPPIEISTRGRILS